MVQANRPARVAVRLSRQQSKIVNPMLDLHRPPSAVRRSP
jgi:hypothetical protein